MKQLPTAALAALALTVGVANVLATPGAHADGHAVAVADVPAPSTLPPSAFLTGSQAVEEAVIDEVGIRLERDGPNGLAAVMVNPTDQAQLVEALAAVRITEGNVASRMGPMAFNLAADIPIAVQLAPGETHRQVIEGVELPDVATSPLAFTSITLDLGEAAVLLAEHGAANALGLATQAAEIEARL